jgi:hypothetical protein
MTSVTNLIICRTGDFTVIAFPFLVDKIPEFWICPQLLFPSKKLFVLQNKPDFTFRVQEVAENPSSGGTRFGTGGESAFSGSLNTERTFLHLSSLA